MHLLGALSGLSPQIFYPKFLRNFLYFFRKKPALKKRLIFSQIFFSDFKETDLSYILGEVDSDSWYIQNWKHTQNPSIFRTRDIFRTLSNIYDGMLCKYSYVAHCLSPGSKIKRFTLKKILYFREMGLSDSNIKNFLIFSQKKTFLKSQETESPKRNFFLF